MANVNRSPSVTGLQSRGLNNLVSEPPISNCWSSRQGLPEEPRGRTMEESLLSLKGTLLDIDHKLDLLGEWLRSGRKVFPSYSTAMEPPSPPPPPDPYYYYSPQQQYSMPPPPPAPDPYGCHPSSFSASYSLSYADPSSTWNHHPQWQYPSALPLQQWPTMSPQFPQHYTDAPTHLQQKYKYATYVFDEMAVRKETSRGPCEILMFDEMHMIGGTRVIDEGVRRDADNALTFNNNITNTEIRTLVDENLATTGSTKDNLDLVVEENNILKQETEDRVRLVTSVNSHHKSENPLLADEVNTMPSSSKGDRENDFTCPQAVALMAKVNKAQEDFVLGLQFNRETQNLDAEYVFKDDEEKDVEAKEDLNNLPTVTEVKGDGSSNASAYEENVVPELASSVENALGLLTACLGFDEVKKHVLEDFDTSFTNKLYHSHLDDLSNINSSSVAAASALVACALYILATSDATLNLKELNSIKVNVSLVEELVRCLLTCEPGLSCGIIKDSINPSNACPSHYVGIFVDSPTNIQYPQYADDTSGFIWNFLADKTSIPKKSFDSCTSGCSKSEVCVGAVTSSGGRCVISTNRYVPANSTQLKFEGGSWLLMPSKASDPMESADPIWTESCWNNIGLRVYTAQSSAYNRIVLISVVLIVAAEEEGDATSSKNGDPKENIHVIMIAGHRDHSSDEINEVAPNFDAACARRLNSPSLASLHLDTNEYLLDEFHDFGEEWRMVWDPGRIQIHLRVMRVSDKSHFLLEGARRETQSLHASDIHVSPLSQVRKQIANLCINILHSYRKFCATINIRFRLLRGMVWDPGINFSYQSMITLVSASELSIGSSSDSSSSNSVVQGPFSVQYQEKSIELNQWVNRSYFDLETRSN